MFERIFQLRGFMKLFGVSDGGSALVEVSIVMPLLCTCLLGAANIAVMDYSAIEVANAASAAAQYGAQSSATASDKTGIELAATSDAHDLKGLTTTVSRSCICSDGTTSTCSNTDCSASQIEQVLTVHTQATFALVFPLPGAPASIQLHGQAVQKVLE